MCFEYVEFVKSSNWENTDSHFRVIAANDLARACVDSWMSAQDDTNFSHATLPTDELKEKYSRMAVLSDFRQCAARYEPYPLRMLRRSCRRRHHRPEGHHTM